MLIFRFLSLFLIFIHVFSSLPPPLTPPSFLLFPPLRAWSNSVYVGPNDPLPHLINGILREELNEKGEGMVLYSASYCCMYVCTYVRVLPLVG